MAAIEVLRAAIDVPFDDALKMEREAFMRLRAGDQSKAQRHIFFAEREATKIPGLGKDIKPREIKRAAVIGAGTMGGGIAMCFANADIPVTLIETNAEALKRGLDIDREELQSLRRARQHERGRCRQANVAIQRRHRHERGEGRRYRGGGGVRGDGRQARDFRQSRQDDVAAGDPGDQHILSRRQRDRAQPPAGRHPCSACISSARRM